MIRIERNGLQWLEFELLADFPEITHAVLTRHGGYSQDHHSSLNLGMSVGDNPEHVFANFQKVINTLSLKHSYSGYQCHGVSITQVDLSNLHTSLRCEITANKAAPQSDVYVTQTPDIGLFILHADCQAAIFYDPTHRTLANVHCGWRGNVQDIYGHVINYMKKNYQSDPKDIHVCISPSLGPENSEFINYKTELPELFRPFQIKPTYFDLWAISEWQLLTHGILPHHIQIARIDTFTNDSDFFSYRRVKLAGRQATICCLNS